MNLHQQLIQEALPNLPENIQYAIATLPWSEKIMTINRKHLLTMDQLEKFKDISQMIAVGLMSSDSYARNLENELGVSRERAEELVFDANHEIFDSLQDLAFGDNGYDIAHEELGNEFDEEGIRLVADDYVPTIHPDHTTFQHDQLLNFDNEEFHTHSDVVGDESSALTENIELVDIPVPQYHEEITEDDFRGVAGHRIPDFQERNKEDIVPVIYNNNILEHVLLQDSYRSKGDITDVSPTEGEQVRQDGDFLNVLKQEAVLEVTPETNEEGDTTKPRI